MPPKAIAEAVQRYTPGTHVCFLNPKYSWVQGVVEEVDEKNGYWTCKDHDNGEVVKKVTHDQVYDFRPGMLEQTCDDLLELEDMHEAPLLHSLRVRFGKNEVYTNIGAIVVAINPFTRSIPWYQDSEIPKYLNLPADLSGARAKPHTWLLAHATYNDMLANDENQTVLVSGESGAGKTEAVKIVLDYLSKLSNKRASPQGRETASQVGRRVMQSSPILEAFGNAKTCRNNNSSRFGKFMQVQFDKEGVIMGAHTIKYLLEKSRVVVAGKGERVYHAFYQLCAGPRAKGLSLGPARSYVSLKSGDTLTIDGVSDAAEAAVVEKAFDEIGFDPSLVVSMWNVLAGILFCGNVVFAKARAASGETVASIEKEGAAMADKAAAMWSVDATALKEALLKCVVEVGADKILRTYTVEQAADARDAVCKALYDAVFTRIVEKVNEKTAAVAAERWIGLLDIFGFETFEVNSFEQLCINLANEQLQHHYNDHVFKSDLQECRREGVNVDEVEFLDNTPCLDLIKAPTKTSIFGMLDEECFIRNGTDASLCEKIHERHSSHPFFKEMKIKGTTFVIKHFAGEVTYEIAGFVEKNRDTIRDTMRNVFTASKDSLTAELLGGAEDDPSSPRSPAARRLTVSGVFRNQLDDLIKLVRSTNPHWVRCIRPHALDPRPNIFDPRVVMRQLKSSGVLETVKIRKQGYPTRLTHTAFANRYKLLLGPGVEVTKDAKGACLNILRKVAVKSKDGQVGSSKVFLKQHAFSDINKALAQASLQYTLILQRVCRGHLVRRGIFDTWFEKNRERLAKEEADRKVAAEAEERARRAAEAELKRQELEYQMRMHSTHTACATVFQKVWRGKLARRRVAMLMTIARQIKYEREHEDDVLAHRVRVSALGARMAAMDKKQAATIAAQLKAQEEAAAAAAKREETARRDAERASRVAKARAALRPRHEQEAAIHEHVRRELRAKEREMDARRQDELVRLDREAAAAAARRKERAERDYDELRAAAEARRTAELALLQSRVAVNMRLRTAEAARPASTRAPAAPHSGGVAGGGFTAMLGAVSAEERWAHIRDERLARVARGPSVSVSPPGVATGALPWDEDDDEDDDGGGGGGGYEHHGPGVGAVRRSPLPRAPSPRMASPFDSPARARRDGGGYASHSLSPPAHTHAARVPHTPPPAQAAVWAASLRESRPPPVTSHDQSPHLSPRGAAHAASPSRGVVVGCADVVASSAAVALAAGLRDAPSRYAPPPRGLSGRAGGVGVVDGGYGAMYNAYRRSGSRSPRGRYGGQLTAREVALEMARAGEQLQRTTRAGLF